MMAGTYKDNKNHVKFIKKCECCVVNARSMHCRVTVLGLSVRLSVCLSAHYFNDGSNLAVNNGRYQQH